jgi:hypothetical protein
MQTHSIERYCARKTRTVSRRALAVVLGVGLHATCVAHPFGDRYAGQRLDLQVDRRGISVGVTVDLPGPLLRELGETADQVLAAVPSAIVVTVDNTTLPAEVHSATHRTDLLQPDTVIAEVLLRVDTPLEGRHDLEVTNGNFIGVPGWYVDTLEMSSDLTLVETSLATELRDGTVELLDGEWSRSELRRRVRAEIDGRLGAWESLYFGVEGTSYRPLEDAYAAPSTTVWRAGVPSPGRAAAVLLWGLVAGFVTPLVTGHASRGRWLALAGVLASASLWVPLPPLVALATAALGTLLVRREPWVAIATMAGLGAAAPAMAWGPWQLYALGAWLIGAGLAWPLRERYVLHGVGVAALLATAVLHG